MSTRIRYSRWVKSISVACDGQTSVTLVLPLVSLTPVKKALSPPSGGFSR